MILIIRTWVRQTLVEKFGLLGALLVFAGCANNYPDHLTYTDTSEDGALVTGIQAYQFNLTTGPRYMQAGAAAQNGEVGDLSGASTRHSTLFGLVEWGNNGVGEAARSGGVREVRTVQNGGIDILWGVVYSEQTTIVTGLDAYANPLPLKFPKEARVLEEGLFLEPNGNLVVKNNANQVKALVKQGEMAKQISIGPEEMLVSYGIEKDGLQTILIWAVSSESKPIILLNDQIATFHPHGCLILTLENGNYVKAYKANPLQSVTLTPIAIWSPKVATAEKKESVSGP
jgi:hypothetical protein